MVTGGTSGIGKSIVQNFVEHGIQCVCVGRNVAKVNDLKDKYANIDTYSCDLSNIEDLKKLTEYIKTKYNKLDILVNCAGVFHTHRLPDITFAEYQLVYNSNLASVIFLTQGLMSLLEESKGNIINIASIGGLQSHIAGQSQYLYASSKAAMIQFSQLCALNYAKKVRVNCICPGPTDTPIFVNRDFSWVENQVPMGYMGKPEDIASLAWFLSSDRASYITGAVIPVDGGAALK